MAIQGHTLRENDAPFDGSTLARTSLRPPSRRFPKKGELLRASRASDFSTLVTRSGRAGDINCVAGSTHERRSGMPWVLKWNIDWTARNSNREKRCCCAPDVPIEDFVESEKRGDLF